MKQTLTTSQAASLLLADEYAKWTAAAAYALAEYYETLESDTGTEIEFDRVAIRCEWMEYGTLAEFAEDYRVNVSGMDEADAERTIRRYIENNSELIELPKGDGFLIRAF